MSYIPQQTSIKGRARVCLELVEQQKLKGKMIVDVGSSFGWLEEQLARTGARVIGIEPNQKALEIARSKLGTFAKFLEGNATLIPLKDQLADIVLFFDVIEHVPKNQEIVALKEINRVLKPNGILLLSSPNTGFIIDLLDPAWFFGHRHYSFSRLGDLLKKAGFNVTHHSIRGGLVSYIYLWALYFSQRFLRGKLINNSCLEKLDDQAFAKPGIHTIYIMAQKI